MYPIPPKKRQEVKPKKGRINVGLEADRKGYSKKKCGHKGKDSLSQRAKRKQGRKARERNPRGISIAAKSEAGGIQLWEEGSLQDITRKGER